ncbi:hypothetical protein WMF39_38050 [Sorangium sp. So ce1504]|uniref:hypothetical protein n=1 Tax=Sorangium sp. So ce1504 TaxID=3133337 RepID=UPI003F6411C3
MSTLKVSLLALAAAILGATLMLGLSRAGYASAERTPAAQGSRRDAPGSRAHTLPPQGGNPYKTAAAPLSPPASAPGPERASPRSPARTAPALDDEEAGALANAQFEAKLRAFEAAPEEHDWAPRAAGALRSELGTLSEREGFKVESLACKSKTCVANVQWDSAEDAIRNNQRIAEAKYSVNCNIQVMGKLGSGENKGSPMSIVFSDCL